MLAEEVVLGIDVGTSRIKAVLLAPDGYRRPLEPVTTPWDAAAGKVEAPVEAFRTCLEMMLQQVEHPRRIAGIGIAGMAESGAAFSDRLGPLTPVISWHDPRGQDGAGALRARFPGLDEKVGQRLRYIASAAKLADLAAGGLKGVRFWLGVPEIFLWHLTGETATEHSLISRTGWYDTPRKDYLPEVAESVGLPTGGLLPVKRAGEVMGQARLPGLRPGIPVTIAGHDHAAAARAVGLRAGDLGNSVGTAESVVGIQPELPDIRKAVGHGVAVSVAPEGDAFCLMAGAARPGIVLSRLARMLNRPMAELDALAESSSFEEDSQTIDEYVLALQEGNKVSLPKEPGIAWRMALRGLGRRTAEAARRLAAVTGPARRIVVFGGGSGIDVWLDEKKNAFSVPVACLHGPDAVAAAAAEYAGVATGWWPTPAGRSPFLDPRRRASG